MAKVDAAGGPTADRLERIGYPKPSSVLAEQTERLLVSSYLLGMAHVRPSKELADDSEVPAITFEEAAGFLKSRIPLTKAEWNKLEPELRFRAFTIAALSTPDAIERVKRMATSAIEGGKPLSEFWTAASAEGSAGLGASPWYWETVYRTNTQMAYNAGRAAEFARAQPEYLEFIGIEDGRQTDICAARSGTILPSTHLFWKKNWPPLHFGCRSTVRPVFQEEVDLVRETNPDWSPTPETRIPREHAAKGFGSNPIDSGSFYKLTPAMLDRAKQYGLIDLLKGYAKGLGIEGLELDVVSSSASVAEVAEVAEVAKKIYGGLFGSITDSELRVFARGSFKNAPDMITSLAAEHADDFSYSFAPGTSFYNPAEKSITIGQRRTAFSFSHEFGHGIDHQVGGWYTSSPTFKAAFKADLTSLINPSTNRFTAKGKAAVESLETEGWNSHPSISDLFSGLTKGRIEGWWSHSQRYWEFTDAREKEVFANLFALRTSGDAVLWEKVREYVPSLCDAIESFLGRK